MCGRISQHSSAKTLAELFMLLEDVPPPPPVEARYNIAPSLGSLILKENRRWDVMRWGLIPSWAKDEKIGYKMINARAETIEEKASFKKAFMRRRCLVPVDGYYEWVTEQGGKQPIYFHMPGSKPFALAGLWEYWLSPDGSEIFSFTVITTAANRQVASIHHRMPVILAPNQFAAWLDAPNQDRALLKSMLQPWRGCDLVYYRVPKLVNNPRMEGPELIKPLRESRDEPPQNDQLTLPF